MSKSKIYTDTTLLRVNEELLKAIIIQKSLRAEDGKVKLAPSITYTIHPDGTKTLYK